MYDKRNCVLYMGGGAKVTGVIVKQEVQISGNLAGESKKNGAESRE